MTQLINNFQSNINRWDDLISTTFKLITKPGVAKHHKTKFSLAQSFDHKVIFYLILIMLPINRYYHRIQFILIKIFLLTAIEFCLD